MTEPRAMGVLACVVYKPLCYLPSHHPRKRDRQASNTLCRPGNTCYPPASATLAAVAGTGGVSGDIYIRILILKGFTSILRTLKHVSSDVSYFRGSWGTLISTSVSQDSKHCNGIVIKTNII